MTLEAQELAAARHFTIRPDEWDELPIDERNRLMAAYIDAKELEYLSLLPKSELDQMAAQTEWVVLNG